jgi:hypothetical protein
MDCIRGGCDWWVLPGTGLGTWIFEVQLGGDLLGKLSRMLMGLVIGCILVLVAIEVTVGVICVQLLIRDCG